MSDLVITVERYGYDSDCIAGKLSIDGELFCYTLEDEKRIEKVANETCIPNGRYEVKLRNTGGMTLRYARSPHYRDFHKGMLHLQDVPGFKWIYIHPGNTDDHTSGCILVGFTTSIRNMSHMHMLARSREAYIVLYKTILTAMDEGKQVFVEVKD